MARQYGMSKTKSVAALIRLSQTLDASRLPRLHVQILYSPLSRARDTALIISEIIGVPAVSEPRLLEQNYGTWEGTARDGEAFFKAKQSLSERLGGGESMLQVAQRVYNLIDDVKADFEATGRVYILVAHNGISRVVESYFRDMTTEEFARFGIKNCECREYTF